MPIFQPELETMPRPELEQLQDERLRERFGIDLEALAQQPFATKSQLRDAYPFGLLRVPLSECVRVHGSAPKTPARSRSRDGSSTWSAIASA